MGYHPSCSACLDLVSLSAGNRSLILWMQVCMKSLPSSQAEMLTFGWLKRKQLGLRRFLVFVFICQGAILVHVF